MSHSANQFILSIESAVAGGSVSLFAGAAEIGRHIGAFGVSRSEDLLPNIEQLLNRSKLAATSLSQIVVSAGPGSFTGIRIGIATALGLSDAVNISVRQLSLLEAIAHCSPPVGELTVALPVGRATACLQSFEMNDHEVTPLTDASTFSVDEFKAKILDHPEMTFLTCGYLLAVQTTEQRSNVCRLDDCLATYLACAAIKSNIADVSEPLFISKHTTG